MKNLFELKNARRVLIEGNLFENNWAHAQNGTAILFTVRNQDGKAPWSAVQDVTMINDVVRNSPTASVVMGEDHPNPSQQSQRFLIRNNPQPFWRLELGHYGDLLLTQKHDNSPQHPHR